MTSPDHALSAPYALVIPESLVPDRRGMLAFLSHTRRDGGFDMQRKVPSTSSPDAPLIRISGTAFMGGVDVRVVDPDARGWLDRLTG